jgi:hypothetical protein
MTDGTVRDGIGAAITGAAVSAGVVQSDGAAGAHRAAVVLQLIGLAAAVLESIVLAAVVLQPTALAAVVLQPIGPAAVVLQPIALAAVVVVAAAVVVAAVVVAAVAVVAGPGDSALTAVSHDQGAGKRSGIGELYRLASALLGSFCELLVVLRDRQHYRPGVGVDQPRVVVGAGTLTQRHAWSLETSAVNVKILDPSLDLADFRSPLQSFHSLPNAVFGEDL